MNEKSLKEEQLTLELLDAIDKNNEVSQRSLAHGMGIALGLANSYLKRCIRKGYIKMRQAPANRYLYYLTPMGFAEKSRLTAAYLSYSFSFYRQASDSCRRAYNTCKQKGWEDILLCGVSELAEIASLRALESELRIIGVYDEKTGQTSFVNTPVYKTMESVPDFDACLVTDLNSPHEMVEKLCKNLKTEQIFVLDILGINNGNNNAIGN